MRFQFWIAAFVCAANVAHAQKQPPAIRARATTWLPSRALPQDIAKQADQMLKSLKGVKAIVDYTIRTSTGDGYGQVVEKYKSPTVFAFELPVIVKGKATTARVVADGKRVTTVVDENWKQTRVGQKRQSPHPVYLAQNWPIMATREILSTHLDGRNPFSEYFNGLQKTGTTLKVQQRSVTFEGHTMRQYMIVANRPPDAAKRYGKLAGKFIFDSDIHLPVTLSVSVKQPGKKREIYVAWNAKWHNNETFTASELKPPPRPTKT
ncbi:MAG: hypothetical protein QOJ65_784 [Fimbriimonadaceae bacterium]|nr:hypothetical protein [Fimbriimonadaceae bacterium]